MPAADSLAEVVEAIAPDVIELRRQLHRHPEPAHREHQTTELIAGFLDRAGLRFQQRLPRTGGWVDIGNDPVVGFRADIDALPIREPVEHEPRSQIDGWMHACGHDAHAAVAAGIAVALDRLSPQFGIRVLFQPGEESIPGGAIELVEEGLVDGLDSLLAFHVDPALAVGRIGARVGAITAGTDMVTIVVSGPGGHTSRPHRTVDVVGAAARVATELPAAIHGSVGAQSAVVTAFGSIHGGDAPNVIPTEVVLEGTVRTLDAALWDELPALVDKKVGAILALSGARHAVDYRRGIAPVVNDEETVARSTRAIRAALGDEAVTSTETSMGGEDFSNYLTVTRGALFRLGVSSGGGDLHSASFVLNEAAIPFGIHAGVSALLAQDPLPRN